MNTRRILSKYITSIICDSILDYGFKHNLKKECFYLGFYEKCEVILEELFKLVISKKNLLYTLEYLLRKACSGGHIKIVKLVISIIEDSKLLNAIDNRYSELYGDDKLDNPSHKKISFGWNHAFRSACECGNMEVVNLMIDNGVDDWKKGLDGACDGGHPQMAKYMISKGAKFSHYNFWMASLGGNIEIFEFNHLLLTNKNK